MYINELIHLPLCGQNLEFWESDLLPGKRSQTSQICQIYMLVKGYFRQT